MSFCTKNEIKKQSKKNSEDPQKTKESGEGHFK